MSWLGVMDGEITIIVIILFMVMMVCYYYYYCVSMRWGRERATAGTEGGQTTVWSQVSPSTFMWVLGG